METYADRYIDKCIDIGILTKTSSRKYPLRSANLGMVLKAYALECNLPLTVNSTNFNVVDEHKLYLTDGGLEWLYSVFKKKDLEFLRRVFLFVFVHASEKDLLDLDNYKGMANFKGDVGVKPVAGTKVKAVLVRSYGKGGKIKKEYHFENIKEARAGLLDLTRFYPVDEFQLYKMKTDKKGYTYKDKITTVLKESKRGISLIKYQEEQK